MGSQLEIQLEFPSQKTDHWEKLRDNQVGPEKVIQQLPISEIVVVMSMDSRSFDGKSELPISLCLEAASSNHCTATAQFNQSCWDANAGACRSRI